MTIATAIPTAIPFATSNLNTESARRENTLRETIPQPANSEGSSAESSTLNEDRAPRAFAPAGNTLVYDRAQLLQNQQQALDNNVISQDNPDNGQDQSAGRENAETRQQEQEQQRTEQQEVQELRARDREVRAHEQAHAIVGGEFAGAPTYEFETGPDGRQYAVAGEVSIDISEEPTAEETLRKAEIVRAAALAPAEPSPQDFRVASQAVQLANQARSDLASERAEEQQEQNNGDDEESDNTEIQANSINGAQEEPSPVPERETPEVDSGVSDNNSNDFEPGNIPSASRTANLENLQETEEQDNADFAQTRDQLFDRRSQVISNFYINATSPRGDGFSQVA